MALKIWDGDSIETPVQVHIKVTDGSIKFVNYAVVKETDGTLSTFFDAIYETAMSTTTT